MKIALTSALVLALAAPAFASGSDQLARSLGLDAGVYTSAQLAQLKAAKDQAVDNDFHFNALVERFSGDAVSTQSFGITDGHRQLAASVGVNAEDYSVAEIVEIINSKDDSEFVVPAAGGDAVSTASGITPGHMQLAAKLGVNAADFSAAEIAAMIAQRDLTDD